MRRQEIVDRIVHEVPFLRQHRVRSLVLFGSVARDEAHDDSDVDLVVDFDGEPTFDDFMDVKLHLEDVLGRRVDLITEAALRAHVRPYVERDALRVA